MDVTWVSNHRTKSLFIKLWRFNELFSSRIFGTLLGSLRLFGSRGCPLWIGLDSDYRTGPARALRLLYKLTPSHYPVALSHVPSFSFSFSPSLARNTPWAFKLFDCSTAHVDPRKVEIGISRFPKWIINGIVQPWDLFIYFYSNFRHIARLTFEFLTRSNDRRPSQTLQNCFGSVWKRPIVFLWVSALYYHTIPHLYGPWTFEWLLSIRR